MAKMMVLLTVLSLFVGCAVPAYGDDVHRDLDWALEIARPVAEEWNPDAYLTFLSAGGIDRSGETIGELAPGQKYGDFSSWDFNFYDGTQYLYVQVYYDGEIEGTRLGSAACSRKLPNSDYHYVFVSNFADWFTIALTVFDAHLDGGDYFYMGDVGWEDDLLKFTAFFSCYDDTGNDLGYVKIDVETGKVFGHSWM